MADTAAAGPAGIRHRGAITLTVMLASMIYALDWTIAAVALPHMQGSFSSTQDQISWVLTSYIVISATMMPVTGWLAGRLGRRTLFMLSVGGFTLFSWLCAVAGSLEAEVVFRLGQGGCGAFLIPLSQSIMLDIYPRSQHARAMALWGVGVMLGPVIGPTIGGYLTHAYSWRWVFFINLPIGALALAGAFLFLRGLADQRRAGRFDWIGFASLGLAVGGTQLMFDRGERLDWFNSGEVVLTFAAVLLGFYWFIVHSLSTRHPLIQLRLLTDRNYALGLTFIFLYGLVTLAPMVLMPPFLQQLQGYPVTTIGILLSPRGLGMMLAMIVFGRLGDRFNPRVSIAGGFLALAFSSWVMSGWNLEVGIWDVTWTGFVQGLGAGSIVVPLGQVTFFTLDPRHRTEASSIWNLTRSLGSSMGIAIALAVLVRMSGTNQAQIVEHVTIFGQLLAPFGATGLRDVAALSAEVSRQAAMIGYVDVFLLGAITACVPLPLVLLVRRAPPLPAEP